MSDDFSLDPELKAIFEEIASGPNTLLAYLPRRKILRAAEEGIEQLGLKSAHLTAAERQLLLVHREQAAGFLRRLFGSRILEDRRGQVDFQQYEARLATVPIDNASHTAAKARSHLQRSERIGDSITDFGIIETVARERQLIVPTLLQLALAAYRLEPTCSSRVHVAMDAIRLRRSKQATRVLHRILNDGCSTRIEPYAWEVLGVAHSRLHDYESALYCCQNASSLTPGSYVAAISILFLTIQLGMEDRIMHAAEHVESLLWEKHPCIESYIRRAHVRRQRGIWEVSHKAKELLPTILPRLNDSSRRIASVFQQAG